MILKQHFLTLKNELAQENLETLKYKAYFCKRKISCVFKLAPSAFKNILSSDLLKNSDLNFLS